MYRLGRDSGRAPATDQGIRAVFLNVYSNSRAPFPIKWIHLRLLSGKPHVVPWPRLA